MVRRIALVEFQNIRHLLSCLRRAVEDYHMITEGDKIAIGMSGGKDSTALLCALYNLRRFYPAHFELCAVTVNTGFEGMDFSPVEALCREMEIEYRLIDTKISEVVFDIRKETNPCSLCAKMRRGILHDTAKEMRCNKLALGHHNDDVVDTFLLNLLNEGRIGSFSPVTYLSRKDLTMIRPLIYAEEKDIRYFMNGNPSLPLVKSTCPEDKNTEREEMKKLLIALDKEHHGVKHRIFGALQKSSIDGWGLTDDHI